jgi:putative copper export protein
VPIAWAVRWVGLAAFAALLGALVLDRLVLPREPTLDATRRRLRRAGDGAAGVLLAAGTGELLLRAATMAGGGAGAGVAAIPAVLAHTHFGTIWIGRLALLVLVPLAWRLAPLAALVLVLGVAATSALTGHAGDWGDRSPTAITDWAHIVAGGAWTGGLLLLTRLLPLGAREWSPDTLEIACRRFSRLAAWCLAAVVATGAWNAWVQLPAPSALWASGYGRALLAKLALVAALVAYGAANRFLVLPRLLGRDDPGTAGRFRRYVGYEAALALAVFAVTAVLTDSTPPRHADHTEHIMVDDGAETPPAPAISMEALHAAGGVPAGWRFTPPPGDAALGREVFGRLGCFACHRVKGERFPAPTGRGPDLTGMGHHHPPGYLLESVLNPDAVIVEGPGYTDARGRSTMPELARGLTVAELLDLVAYLRTL